MCTYCWTRSFWKVCVLFLWKAPFCFCFVSFFLPLDLNRIFVFGGALACNYLVRWLGFIFMNIYTAYCFELNSLGVLQSSRRISRDGWESSKNTKISFLDFWLYGKGGEWCQIFPATPFRFFIFFHNDKFFGFSCIGGELLRGRKRKRVFFILFYFFIPLVVVVVVFLPPYLKFSRV